jgi:uncharacterized protein YegL
MKSKTKAKASPKNKPTLVAFLLDRTGSMASVIEETIRGFNGYLDTLKDKKAENILFTLTQFDTISIDIVHNAVPLNGVKPLNRETYQPRGGTPLYDAIGKTIRATEAVADGYKILFVTLTDGEENSSSEWNQETIKALMKEKEEKDHWTFAHIGVGEGAWDATTRLADGTRSASNVLNVKRGDTVKTFARFAATTQRYATGDHGISSSATNLWKSSGDEE